MRLYFDNILAERLFFWEYERSERTLLARLLRPGDIFVDVGANEGLYTLIAARRVIPGGRVYAFEPSRRSSERLAANVLLNGYSNVTCSTLALSDVRGSRSLHVPPHGFQAWSSLAGPHVDGGVEETVETEAWRSFASANDLVGRITFMKLDVEGWELKVLEGAREILQRDDAPILQVEFCETAARLAGSSCAELYDLLVDLGYRLFRFQLDSGLDSEPYRGPYDYANLLAIKRLDVVSRRLSLQIADHRVGNRLVMGER